MKDMSVNCNIDSLVNEHPNNDNRSLQTKAAKLIHKVIGNNADLTRFDELRLRLKDNKKEKPTPSDKNEYETVLAKVQIRVLALKYSTKDNLKSMERECMAKKGLYVGESNSKYKDLYKKLELAKKVLNIWSNFDI